MTVRILHGHVLDQLAELPDESVNAIVTSPPYWGLRSYGTEPQIWGGADPACEHEWGDEGKSAQRLRNGEGSRTAMQAVPITLHPSTGTFCRHCGAWRGELGLEPSYTLYVEHIVTVFDALWRVLRNDGTAWLNLGDCYATGGGRAFSPGGSEQGERYRAMGAQVPDKKNPNSGIPVWQQNRMPQSGLKPKDLVGIPWRCAFALQDRGWWLRKDNIVHKRNPMPESVNDRTTTAHEYVFHLTKAERYWYDADSIKEAASYSGPNAPDKIKSPYGQGFTRRSGNKQRKPAGLREVPGASTTDPNGGVCGSIPWEGSDRNRRSVWTVNTSPTPEAHFATMPETVAEICILAGCPVGGTVLDPFLGSGTTARVADRLARNCIGIDLQPDYIKMAARRTREPGLALEVAAE